MTAGTNQFGIITLFYGMALCGLVFAAIRSFGPGPVILFAFALLPYLIIPAVLRPR